VTGAWSLQRENPNPLDLDLLPVPYAGPDCKQDTLLVDGTWTGNDYQNAASNFEIINGQICGMTPNTKRQLWSSSALDPVPLIDLVNTANNPANVQTLLSVFT